jgi:hypothetical protein
MTEASPESALPEAAAALRLRQQAFALVGGLAVSIRGEVRFTRDVDLAITVSSDTETETLVRALGAAGYRVLALVEQEERKRLATVRLAAPAGIVVDLLAASSGIEHEVVERALPVIIEGAGAVPVARAEELLALKILSMTERRPQDRIDALSLLESGEVANIEHGLAGLGIPREQLVRAA